MTDSVDSRAVANEDVFVFAIQLGHLVSAAQILPRDRFMDTVFKGKHLSQRQPHLCLEAGQHKVGTSTFGDLIIAVVAGLIAKHAVDSGCVPKLQIFHWGKPLNHVLNVFKDHHSNILPDADSLTQIWRHEP